MKIKKILWKKVDKLRPIHLEIEGLQSFQELQTIDFNYLGETGLFGIFGPTGSGKSTILDAITFALYGKVKRADRGTQGIINTNKQQVKVSFEFELQKGNERKKYRAERVYKRKKDSDILCEPKITRLIEVTQVGEIPISDKATEVTRSIENLLGLNYDDFTRAVVLPQNSFQEFLLLDNAKKREMLERIFYLEEYGKQLLDKLHRKIGKLKGQIEFYSGQLQGYAEADEEALKAAKEKSEKAETERKKVEEAFKNLDKKYNETKIVWDLVQDLEVVNEQEVEFNEKQQEMRVKQANYNKAIKADELKYLINREKETLENLKLIRETLEHTIKEFNDTSTELEKAKQKYESIKNEAERQRPIMAQRKSKMEDAMEIKKELDKNQEKFIHLKDNNIDLDNNIIDKRSTYSKLNDEKEQLEKNLGEIKETIKKLHTDPSYRQQLQGNLILEKDEIRLDEEYKELLKKWENTKSQCNELTTKLTQADGEVESRQKELTHLNLEKQTLSTLKPQDRDELQNIKDKSIQISRNLEIIQLHNKDLDEFNDKREQLMESLASVLSKIKKNKYNQDKAKKIYEESKNLYEEAKEALERNTAYMLSKNLQEGVPCPVCGSEHHPDPASYTEDNDIKMLEQRVEDAKNKMEEAEKECNKIEEERFALESNHMSLIDKMNDCQFNIVLKKADITVELRKLPVNMHKLSLNEIQQEIKRLDNKYSQGVQAVKDWEEKDKNVNDRIESQKELLNQSKISKNDINVQLNSKQEYYQQITHDLSNTQVKFQENHKIYFSFIEQYEITSIEDELNKVTEKDHKIAQLQEQADFAERAIIKLNNELKEINENINALNEQIIQLNSQMKTLEESQEEKQLKIKKMAGDVCIEAEIKSIEAKLEEYNSLEKSYQDAQNELQEKYQKLENKKIDLQNQQKFINDTYDKTENELMTSLQDKGFTTKIEAEEAILSKEEQSILEKEINNYKQKGLNISTTKENILKKLGDRTINEDDWAKIATDYKQIQEQKQTSISNSEVAKNEYERIKEKHKKWIILNDTHSSMENKQDFLIQIQKLLRGERGKDNSFIDYVAEERLRYVAAKASETLGYMTKYKYGLELDVNSGFVIRDYTNGGVLRMATSLSGGETFLTSLSLALALSEQIQLKGQSPLEFFFLDEGFGTLDNQLLDTVMDALERLSNQERIIGLISHVPELKSRLGRRLIIDPPTSQGQGSQVRMEKA